MSYYLRLLGRDGEFLRHVDEEEARDLCKYGKATHVAHRTLKTLPPGKPLTRFPSAQANRHVFVEKFYSGAYLFSFTRRAIREAEIFYEGRTEKKNFPKNVPESGIVGTRYSRGPFA